MTPSLLTTAAARKAELLAELQKIEALAAAGETVAAVLDLARVVQLNNTTIAVSSKSGGGAFDTFVLNPALVGEVRQFIAVRLEALALAQAGAPSPQQPAEQQPAPAPEPTVASSAAAVDSTPTRDPEAELKAAAERAFGAGYRYRAEQRGQRKSPYKPGPLTEAWLAGWDEADAATKAEAAAAAAAKAETTPPSDLADIGGRSSAYMAGRTAFMGGRYGSTSEAEAQAGYTDPDDVADFRRGYDEAEELAATEPQFVQRVRESEDDVDPFAPTPAPAPEPKNAPAKPAPPAKAAPASKPAPRKLF